MVFENPHEEHPFEERTVIDKSEPSASVSEIHLALSIIDNQMDWIRREMEQLARNDRSENELVKKTDETLIYRISENKWREVVDDFEGPMYTDKTFHHRTSVAVQRVHYQYADYKTGGFGGGNAMVLSKQD